jgi:hypothetical protein
VLPDFPIELELNGERRSVIARDVPTALFFAGFPDSVPMARCFEEAGADGRRRIVAALETWVDALLTRVVVTPRLSLELVHRLGPARDTIADAYLRGIGWIEGGPLPTTDAELLAPDRREHLPETWASLGAAVAVPAPNLRTALRMLSARGRVLPSVLWALPISEWIWNFRVLLSDRLKRAELPGEIEAIGFEDEA